MTLIYLEVLKTCLSLILGRHRALKSKLMQYHLAQCLYLEELFHHTQTKKLLSQFLSLNHPSSADTTQSKKLGLAEKSLLNYKAADESFRHVTKIIRKSTDLFPKFWLPQLVPELKVLQPY